MTPKDPNPNPDLLVVVNKPKQSLLHEQETLICKDDDFSNNYNAKDGKVGWAQSTFHNPTTATGYKASCSSGRHLEQVKCPSCNEPRQKNL